MRRGEGTERLRLEVLGEGGRRAELPERGMLVVGSSAERAGLVLEGQGIEDAHCAIGRVKTGGWAIKDLGTRYGTFLNGERITSTRLAAGDVIVVGSRRLAVVDPAAPVAPGTPAAAAPPTPAPARGPAPAPLVEGAAAPRAPEVPERLGGYRIQKLLGRGGMGLVYLAVQESLSRPVALKVVSSTLEQDPDFVRRFQSEARAAAALNHPNVVVVHDVGEAEGHHYLSMEFMAGGSLEERVARHGPIPWREVLDVLYDAARGLTYAEERGIVHRDIKPANLMADGTGTTKIADLGLATGIEAEDDERGRKIYGTPHFISPEQARGETVDGRSDLYSLGATAYRLLSGRTPFTGETTRDILRAHFTEQPAPIPDVPDRLNELIQKLLAKSPADRFQRAEELVQAVDRLRAEADHGLSAPAAPARRGPLVLAGLGLGVAVLVTAGLWAAGLLGGGRPGEEGAGGRARPGDVAAADPDAARPDPGFFEAGTGPDAPAVDEEHELKVLELEAELAYSKVPADLAPAERAAALRELAQRFAVTTTAGKARAEAEELEAEAARRAAEAARRAQALAGLREGLARAAGWPPPGEVLPRPGDALRQVLAYEAPGELAGAPEAAEARRELQDEIVATSRARFAAELERADALAREGEFTEVERSLRELVARFDLPEYPAGEAPAGWDELVALGARARELRDGLPDRERAWNLARQHGDRQLLAQRLGLASDFHGELRALALEATEGRLAALEQELRTTSARAVVTDLREELRYGRDALAALVEGYGLGEWRRKTIVDPRGRRTTTREAVGATAEGIRVDADGVLEVVPWSAFDRAGLEQLFKGRLTRSYTEAEIRGITFLLALAATLEAAEHARDELRTDRRSVFQQAEADALPAAFETALHWAGGAGEGPAAPPQARARVERLRAAAEVLARALLAAEDGSWTVAVAGLETLFAEHGDGLLVTLLSDGTEWRAPEQASADEAAAPAAGDPPGSDPVVSPTDDPTNGE